MTQTIYNFDGPFTEEMWETLGTFIEKLPEKVRLVVWASERNSCTEGNAVDLGRTLADRFEILEFRNRPRKANYAFYPVLGVMGVDERDKDIDYGVRFIGLPAWYQINSLVGAIQAVSFKGSKLEPKTRIQLSRMPDEADIKLEVFTAPQNESGVLVATLAANLAVGSPRIRTWIAMVNDFPQLAAQKSIYEIPHTVINGRYHFTGICDEEEMLRHIAKALR